MRQHLISSTRTCAMATTTGTAPVAALIGALALGAPLIASAGTHTSEHADFRLQTHAEGLNHPWSIAFLPDGSQLVTERAGRIRLIRDGHLVDEPVPGAPDAHAQGQGGMLDLLLHPDFEDNHLLFISYTHRNSDGMTTQVDRAEFRDGALHNRKTIFSAGHRTSNPRHFGGRMVIPEDGYLYVAVGDRGEMDRAQDFADDAGAVHRITINGDVPDDNPFLDRNGASPTLFTKGNRNIQGMVLHPDNGDIWSHEHGPRGGDEINIIRAGFNYGWPKVTHGVDYSGAVISDQTDMEGMEYPLHHWTPSIAPSGMAFYTGEGFPDWQGDLFVGGLRSQKLVRVTLDGEAVASEENLLTDLGERFRDVRMGPDGALWLLTDSPNGKVIRLVPADQ